jgi:hypothetical protein
MYILTYRPVTIYSFTDDVNMTGQTGGTDRRPARTQAGAGQAVSAEQHCRTDDIGEFRVAWTTTQAVGGSPSPPHRQQQEGRRHRDRLLNVLIAVFLHIRHDDADSIKSLLAHFL